MSDDVPIPETVDSQIWSKCGLSFLRTSDIERMTNFVRESVGSTLSIDSATDLIKKSHTELFALAVRAQQAEVDDDAVASLLVFAIARGSNLAAGALAQLIGERLSETSRIGGGFAGRRALRRVLREVEQRLSRRALLEKFDDFRKEIDAAGEAVRLGQIWSEFKRAGVDGTSHRVLAPHLKSLRHLDGGGDEFKVLTGPLPLWSSPVPVAVLAKVLAAEFPHFTAIADDVAQFIAGGSQASTRPLLLVGPAGIGKDSLLRRAAQLVARPFGEYDLAGSSDNRILKGTSKGWSTAAPGHAATICVQFRCANPLLLYSELDRAGGSRRNGMVSEALLGLCEPSTRSRWFDDGLGTALDLTDVAIGFTANATDDTPGPLLTRLRVIKLERPKAEHVAGILAQALRRLAAELQVPVDDLPEPVPEVVERLEAVAGQGRFHLRLAERVVRALGEGRPRKLLN